MIVDASLFAVCGRYCGNCVWYLGEKETSCPGCSVHKGHPAWGECKVYSCVDKNHAEFCGLCDEFPCDLLVNYYDPGNPEGPRNAAIRVAVNAYRAKHGDGKTLDYLRRVGALNKQVK
jgi:hypothetical protein